MNTIRIMLLMLASGLATLATAAIALRSADHGEPGEREEIITLSELPGPVRKTIIEHAGERGDLVVSRVSGAGVTYYEAEWRDAGKEAEVFVSEEGKLLSGDPDGDGEDGAEDGDAPEDVGTS